MTRRLNLAESNPVMSAIQGYKAVDDIFETNRQRKRAEEDRSMAIQDRERNLAWQQEQQEQIRMGWANTAEDREREKQKLKYQQMQFQIDQLGPNATNEQYWGVLQQDPELVEQIKGQWNPKEVETARQAESLLHKGMELAQQGDLQLSKKVLIDALNLQAHDLNRGTAREDIVEILSKKVVDLNLHESGGVVPLLEIEGIDKNGKKVTYKEWSTKGQGTGTDDPVNIIYPEQAQKVLYTRRRVAEAIDAMRVGLGDTAPMEELKKRNAAIQNSEWTAKLSTELAKIKPKGGSRVATLNEYQQVAMRVAAESGGLLSEEAAMKMVGNLYSAADKDMTVADAKAAASGKPKEGSTMNWKDSNATIDSALKDLSDHADLAMPAKDGSVDPKDGSVDPKYAAIEQRVVYQMRNGIQNHPEQFIKVYGDHPIGQRVHAADLATKILMEKDADMALAEMKELDPVLYPEVVKAIEGMMSAYPTPQKGGGATQADAIPDTYDLDGGWTPGRSGAGIHPDDLKNKKKPNMTTDGRPDILKMWVEGVVKPQASPIKDVLDSMAEFYLIQPGKALWADLSEFAEQTHDYPAIP